MSNIQVRIATKDITICKLDKRKRYGFESLGVVKAGTVFSMWAGDATRFHPSYLDLGNMSGPVRSDVATALIEGSIEKPLDTFADLAKFHDMTRWGDDILEYLLKSGRIDIATLNTAMKELIEQHRSE